jgi:hypothetical protein
MRAPSPRKQRGATLIVAAGLVVAFACGDPYLHTNPYDPAVPVDVTITGPDSLFSYGEIAQFGVETIPAFPDSAVIWTIDTVTVHRGGNLDTIIGGMSYPNPGAGDTIVPGDSIFKPLGLGGFQSLAPPLEPKSVTGEAWSVWVDGFDALGRQIYTLTGATTNPPGSPPIATFVSRDTTIAAVTPVHIRAATVTALRSGTTWVVATRGTLLDSLQVVVR